MSLIEPAVSRLPIELWEDILELVVEPPFIYDTECTLESFYEWTQKVLYGTRKLFRREAEKQRCKLTAVCRPWKRFADAHAASRKHRLPLNRLRQVDINDQTATALSRYHGDVQWRILVVNNKRRINNLDAFEQICQSVGRLTRVRRIDIEGIRIPFLLSMFSVFSCVTCLSITHPGGERGPRPLSRFTFRLVTTLMWNSDAKYTPSDLLVLPSLQHLRLFVVCRPRVEHDIDSLIRSYTSTLKSLTLLPYRGKFPLDALSFPDWELLPRLDEVVLERLPITWSKGASKPLKRFHYYGDYLDSAGLDVITRLINEPPVGPLVITLRCVRWEDSKPGLGMGVYLYMHTDLDQLAEVWRLCGERGIRLEDRRGSMSDEVRTRQAIRLAQWEASGRPMRYNRFWNLYEWVTAF
jgi:hypothetical protein